MAESVVQYEAAAGERLYDGMAIALTDGRETSRGSVYLFGYVIEMVLKAAYFRLVGWNPAQPVDLKIMARSLGKRSLGAGEAHDIDLLWRALHAERTTAGLAPHVDGQAKSQRSGANWDIDQRYDSSACPSGVVAQMYEDAAWFYANRLALTQ